MNRKKKWFLFTLLALGLQLLTYFLFGLNQLRDELLTDNFGALLDTPQDRVFVCDFYVTDCGVGDSREYYSHNLGKTLPSFNKKLRAKTVFYQTREQFNWYEHPETQYSTQYYTWVALPDWFLSAYLFQAEQHETLIINQHYGYSRDVTYRWCLFTWVKTFERRDSWDRRLVLQDALEAMQRKKGRKKE